MSSRREKVVGGCDGEQQPPPIAMVQCDDCGHRLPEANMAIHRATCHIHRMEPDQGWRGGEIGHRDNIRDGNANGSISGEYSMVFLPREPSLTATTSSSPMPSAPPETDSAETPPSAAASATPAEPSAPQNQWACPRCTLQNSMTSNTCDACLYQHHGSQAQAQSGMTNATNGDDNTSDITNGNQRFQVDVTDITPQSELVGSAVRWGIVGAFFGGAVGALVAGGAAAAISGVQSLQDRRQRRDGQRDDGGDASTAAATGAPNNNPGRRPFFTFTSTSYSSTPGGGSTMTVTSNASGQRRRMTIRDTRRGPPGQWQHVARNPGLNRTSQLDRRILQMLARNAVHQGAATTETADQMTLNELLHQFQFPGTDINDLPQGRNRGATPARIERCTVIRTLDTEDSVGELEENKNTCNICLEKFERGDNVRKITYCSHTFHKECIDRWLSQVASCPICKHELDPQ